MLRAAALFGGTALISMQFVGAMVASIDTARVIRLTLVAMPLVLVATGSAGRR